MSFSMRASFVAATLFLASSTTALAQAVSLENWKQTTQADPVGTTATENDATVSRYFISDLDAANAGGLSKVSLTDAEARMDHALSIIEMGMADYEMTTLYGMPAAVGTSYTSDGEVAFAASFSGRAGTENELLSVFMAPQARFDALGGIAMLKENSPRAVDVRAAQKSIPKPTSKPAPKPTPRTAQAPKPTPRPAAPKPAPRSGGYSAEGLLAGVRGDLNRMEEQNARERAVAKAAADKAEAARTKAERERIYAESGARRGNYPAPTAKEEFLAWPSDGFWQVQVKGDDSAPRVATRSYNGTQANPSTAFRSFIKDSGLKVKGATCLEALESYKRLDGRDVRILLTETRMNGKPAVAFVLYAKGKGSTSSKIRVMEVPAKTYVAWGGVAGMLKLRGVIPSPNVFPKAERRRIARAPLSEQTAFYEAVLDKFYMENALALMMTQAQTTAMMTELNYDLLFGNDITPGPWGD